MPILGFCAICSEWHVVNINFLLLDRKSEGEKGGFWGLIFKI
jgi:hypothetical protein